MVECQESADYQKLNKALDDVEKLLLRLTSEKQILGAAIERWRWDEPGITLMWSGSVERNIHVHIVEEQPTKVRVEVNAWWDEDREGGKVRVRHWQSRIPFPKLPLSEVNLSLLVKAHDAVCKWTESDLEKQDFLSVGYGGAR